MQTPGSSDKLREAQLESTLWSALTSQRFGRSRPVAAMVRLNPGKDAASSRRRPKR